MALDKSFSAYCVGFIKLLSGGYGIIAFTLPHTVKTRQINYGFGDVVLGFDLVANSADVLQGFECKAVGKALGNFHCLELAHSVDKDVRLCVEKD